MCDVWLARGRLAGIFVVPAAFDEVPDVNAPVDAIDDADLDAYAGTAVFDNNDDMVFSFDIVPAYAGSAAEKTVSSWNHKKYTSQQRIYISSTRKQKNC